MANSRLLYVLVGIGLLYISGLVVVFMRKAWRRALELGIPKKTDPGGCQILCRVYRDPIHLCNYRTLLPLRSAGSSLVLVPALRGGRCEL